MGGGTLTAGMGGFGQVDRRAFLAALATAAAPAPAFARAGSRYAPLEAFLDRQVAEGRVPGAILALVRPGRFRPDYLATGVTEFGGRRAVDADTLFRIYSMTKCVTGMAAMQAVGEGILGLDMPVAEVFPAYREMRVLLDPAKDLASRPAERPMRLRHLLTHTAGLSYTISGDGPLEQAYRRLGLAPTGSLALREGDAPPPDLATFAARLATLPLMFEPGTAWRYAVGLDLVGAMLEAREREPLDRLFERRLFRPLGMASTGFVVPPADRARFAAAYGWVDPATMTPVDRPTRVDGPDASDYFQRPTLLAGGAGLVSSARDFAAFAQMLLNDGLFEGRRVLPAGIARLAMGNLLEPGVFWQPGPGMPPAGYGAGGSVTLFDTRAADPAGTPAGVYGWGGAAGTLFHVDPVRRYAVVLLLQYLPSSRFPVGRELQQALNQAFPAAA
ncbi:serine hydrolase domain-containing protein [Thermaurantiacus tibetensis]|uniref:serine hydrolase domain-containing protein n=1 Tax=Thermaurantiacus tibetensis TaxID=2759035 RepID=UPI00188FB586|nr:serine hydrolase domain-containing protein [Thermaurantiacus tibetensis]